MEVRSEPAKNDVQLSPQGAAATDAGDGGSQPIPPPERELSQLRAIWASRTRQEASKALDLLFKKRATNPILASLGILVAGVFRSPVLFFEVRYGQVRTVVAECCDALVFMWLRSIDGTGCWPSRRDGD
jgi:hypothetical protein